MENVFTKYFYENISYILFEWTLKFIVQMVETVGFFFVQTGLHRAADLVRSSLAADRASHHPQHVRAGLPGTVHSKTTAPLAHSAGGCELPLIAVIINIFNFFCFCIFCPLA